MRVVPMAVIVLVIGILAGCSDDPVRPTTTRPSIASAVTTSVPGTTPDADAPLPTIDVAAVGDVAGVYCSVARNWAARELEGMDPADPDSLAGYSKDQQAYAALGSANTPVELRESWAAYETRIGALSAAYELAGWSSDAADPFLTDELHQVADGTDPDGQAIYLYDVEVCAIGEPPQVDIDAAGADPGLCPTLQPLVDLRTGVVGQGSGTEYGEALISAMTGLAGAPPTGGPGGLADDVSAYARWMVAHAVPVLRRFGDDMTRVLREGSPQDAVAVSGWDPEIRDPAGRVESYALGACAPDEIPE